MPINTDDIVKKIIEEGESSLEELYASIPNDYVFLLKHNFSNLVVLSSEYVKAYVSGDAEKVKIKAKSIEFTFASIFSLVFSAIDRLESALKTIVATKFAEFFAYFSSQLLLKITEIAASLK